MSSKNIKWNSAQIIEFLEIYEHYPVLWNSSLKEYKYRNLRDAAFEELVDQLYNTFPNITLELLRSKIKSIKTIISQECLKITKSKKYGAGADEIYKPKLSWFNAARFLIGSSFNGRSILTLDKDLQIPTTGSDVIHDPSLGEYVHYRSSSKRQPKQQEKISKYGASGMQPRRSKKFKGSELQIGEDFGQQQTVKPANNCSCIKQTDDELSLFGKYVTAQLRLLSPIKSLKAQNAIQKFLINKRIKSLKQNKHNQISTALSPVTSIIITDSGSSNEEWIQSTPRSLQSQLIIGV